MKEISHERPYIVWFYFYGKSRIDKSIETEIRLVIAHARNSLYLHHGSDSMTVYVCQNLKKLILQNVNFILSKLSLVNLSF